jgi:anti-sigma regulatory factor (Ser/Thr protein kinase)
MTDTPPSRLTFAHHSEVLEWLDTAPAIRVDLEKVQNVHIWALVALGALARRDTLSQREITVRFGSGNAPSRFAYAVGFQQLIGGSAPAMPVESSRTVRLRHIRRFDEIERAAAQISRLLLQSEENEDTRQTLYYILVEFLRNAVQHSRDPGGAVVGAQLMDKTAEYEARPVIQVAVGDAGIGVMESLRQTYPEIPDPYQALVMAQQPWVSSVFHPGTLGGPTNAGLGLFFISEMAKKAAGRFLLSSRGGTVLLEGDPQYTQHHYIDGEQHGFPGTLVVFELPLGEIEDYRGLLSVIQDLAQDRIPARRRIRWLRLEPAPKGSLSILVRIGAEDTAHAEQLVEEHLLPRVARAEAIELDFAGVHVCTQSFVHALLFSVLREAYARRSPVHITNASPAVFGVLDFLESYALTP